MHKVMEVQKAIQAIPSNSCLMVGGFGLVGTPLTLLEALTHHPVKNLTVISNNLGEKGVGLGKLLQQGKIKKAIGSFFTSNPDVVERYNQGELEIELVPQGTLSESIRAGGAGIGGFYTKTGIGTKLAAGKESRVINGETYLFEKALTADIALIKAHKADRLGNLVYYKTARNFNPLMATAARYVICEVDEIVDVGRLAPEEIVTPFLYVDAIVQSQWKLSPQGVIAR